VKSLRHPLECESLARVLFGNEQQQNHTATPIPYRHDYNAQATFLAKLTDTDHTLTTSYVDLKSLRLSVSPSLRLSLSLSLSLSVVFSTTSHDRKAQVDVGDSPTTTLQLTIIKHGILLRHWRE